MSLLLFLTGRFSSILIAAILAFYSVTLVQAKEISLKCDPCIDRPTYSVQAIVHGTESEPFWQEVRAAALQSSRDLRVALSFPLRETFDPDVMAAEIIAAATGENPPDALIVTVPTKTVEEAVSVASNNIPVFGFNSGYEVADKAGMLGFVAMDEYEGGQLAAKEFLMKKNVTRALFVNHAKGNTALDARFNGFNKTLHHASNATVRVDELVVDLNKDSDLGDIFEGCPFDAVLLGGVPSFELVASTYDTNKCSFSETPLGTFDISSGVYDSIAVGKLAFAISQQQHLQGAMSVLMAALYATTGKKLAPSGVSETGIYKSGPVVKKLSNFPSDTLQTCEADAFPVCPNDRAPDGQSLSDCPCTERQKIKIGGVVHGYTTDIFWDHVFAAANQAALDMDVELDFPRFEPIDNDPNREILQAKMANKMISFCQEGVDGLFVSVPGPNVFSAIEECQSLGIPVLSINAGADFSNDLGVIHHISQIERNAGKGAGQLFIEKGIKTGVFLNHKPGRTDLEDRGWGYRDAIEEAAAEGADVSFLGIIDVPFDSKVQFKKKVEESINEWGGNWDNLGILLGSSSLVEGALSVHEEHPETLIGSFDTSNEIFEAIDEGKLLFGIDQEPYLQGYMPVVLLTWYAYTGQKLSNIFIESGPVFIQSTPSLDRQVCEATSFEVCPEPVDYDYNHLDIVRPIGLSLFGIIVVTAITIFGWVVWNRTTYIVRASQPVFLIMIIIGSVILGSAIIPLSIDDGLVDESGCDIACMAFPWLFFIGFTIAFSALFSKTWRINKLMTSARHFSRVKVMPRDVILPFIVLLVLNVALLLIWTLVDPMKWERKSSCGSSEVETYGVCTLGDNGSVAILSCLVALNFLLIILANYQAYCTRMLTVEFDESRYVGLVMITILQMSIICLPVMFLVTEDPEARFIVQACLIFVLAMSMLLLIFVPKIIKLRTIETNKKEGIVSSYNTTTIMGLRVMSSGRASLNEDKMLELAKLIDEQGVESEPLFRKVGISLKEVKAEQECTTSSTETERAIPNGTVSRRYVSSPS